MYIETYFHFRALTHGVCVAIYIYTCIVVLIRYRYGCWLFNFHVAFSVYRKMKRTGFRGSSAKDIVVLQDPFPALHGDADFEVTQIRSESTDVKGCRTHILYSLGFQMAQCMSYFLVLFRPQSWCYLHIWSHRDLRYLPNTSSAVPGIEALDTPHWGATPIEM